MIFFSKIRFKLEDSNVALNLAKLQSFLARGEEEVLKLANVICVHNFLRWVPIKTKYNFIMRLFVLTHTTFVSF